jgi:hypothetical protein
MNNLLGWLIFVIAAFTYCSTIEPTASFWDCPEFISTAYKFDVGHPPGAPFFMLVGKFFTLFASDTTQVALMVNVMSALLSAGCILLLFWSITHLARRLMMRTPESFTTGNIVATLGAGVGGALIYTWSDTFWFSAVEAEVYAFSSFFTALVFWLILKWEDNADDPRSDRWLVFIAYLTGLSVGVHLLNLLCIPAIVLVYYYRRAKNPTAKGSLLMLGVSALLIAAVLYGIVPGIVKVGGWFELLFVNQLGMSYNTGLFVYIILLVAALVWGLYETQSQHSRRRMQTAFLVCFAMLGIPFLGHGTTSVVLGILIIIAAAVALRWREVSARVLNTALLCMTVITIGYSSYAVIVIRSAANPPMDQNSPEDVFALGDYLGREQYGETPLLWGPTYASQPEIVQRGDMLVYNTSKGAKLYQRKAKASEDEKDEYIVVDERISYKYSAAQSMVFPRIYEPKHADNYRSWLGDVKTKTVVQNVPGGEPQVLQIPTQSANLQYFFSYQMNFMYWRYFMWNFVGRQNDMQGGGELEHGNWITGIPVVDNAMLGDQSKLPSDIQENKGRNVFYALPLILGLLGFFWQAFRGKEGVQQFWVVFFLFFMTGIAIVLYLNQVPNQPRERDYAYAGSFYAFAIWCGLGVAAIYEWLSRRLQRGADAAAGQRKALVAAAIACVPAVAVPLQMVSQTWDDHDRSDRFMCRDFGRNYLETGPHGGIIFSTGDNDTFPLWYTEDTEGHRTDVRVCNLSYVQTDWYIDQMKRPAYAGAGESKPLPISWARTDYATGRNEVVDVNPTINYAGRSMPMKEVIKQIYAEDSATARKIWGDEPFEVKNAIQKFVLKKGIPEEYRSIVAQLPAAIPSDTVYLNVDQEAVRRSGMKLWGDTIPARMEIDLGTYDRIGQRVSSTNRLYKSFMMMLEIIVNTNFSRPVYMATTVGPSNYGGLFKHFVLEGMAWRITPYTFSQNQVQSTVIDADIMYKNMMTRYAYGNCKAPGIYIDEPTMRMCQTHRRWLGSLAKQLLAENRRAEALKVAELAERELPAVNVPHDSSTGSIDMAAAFVANGKYDKAIGILNDLEKKAVEYAEYYTQLNDYRFRNAVNYCYSSFVDLSMVQQVWQSMGDTTRDAKRKAACEKKLQQLDQTLQRLYQPFALRCSQLGIQLR